MSRYVDAEKMPSGSSWDALNDKEKAVVLSFLIQLPTADVEEVRIAMFEECANNSGYKCSRCKARVKIRDVVNGTHKYCYKCGARFVGVIPYDDGFKEKEK